MLARISHSILVLLIAASLVAAFPRPAKAMFHCQMTGELLSNCCCKADTSCTEETAETESDCCASPSKGSPPESDSLGSSKDCGCCNIILIKEANVLPVLQDGKTPFRVAGLGGFVQRISTLTNRAAGRISLHSHSNLRSSRPAYVLHQSFLI